MVSLNKAHARTARVWLANGNVWHVGDSSILYVSWKVVGNNQPIAAFVVTPLYRHLKASRLYVTPITEGVRQSIDILLWRFVIRLLQVFVLRNSDQLSWRGNMVLQHSKQSNLLLHMEPPWQRSLLLTWLCIWAAHSGGRLFLLTVNHVNIIRRDITNYVRRVTHRCQPSRIRRDSPAFSSDVPRPAKWDKCPAFL